MAQRTTWGRLMYGAVILHKSTVNTAALAMAPGTKIFLMLAFCALIDKSTDGKTPNDPFTSDCSLCLAHIKRAKRQRVYCFICHIL